MNKIELISDVVVRGGVTDGERTVFYNDVMGVEVKKGKRRSFFDWIMLPFVVLFVVGGLIMTLSSLRAGNYGDAGIGIFLALFCGAYYCAVGSVWVVKVRTSGGTVKLLFPRSILEPLLADFVIDLPDRFRSNVQPELGSKVAEILIRRKGQLYSHRNHDLKYCCWHLREGDAPTFFQIDGDDIQVLEYVYDNKPVIKDSAHLDGLVRVERVNCPWNQVIIANICHRQYEVVLHFDTGDTTTHYISHHFVCGPASDHDLAGQLIKALENYVTNTK